MALEVVEACIMRKSKAWCNSMFHHPSILVMSKLAKFLSLSNPLELCSHHFPSRLHRSGGTNEDPVVWLDGARPPNKYSLEIVMSVTESNPMSVLGVHLILIKIMFDRLL
jgi:hypothetical protein